MKYIYIIFIFALFGGAVFAHDGHEHENPVAGLTEVGFTKLQVNDYSFHLYTADGKIYEGYTDIYIALKDGNGDFVENFEVGNFAPVMDMGTMSHSTPIGKVTKVEHKSLYKTWFAGLMDGDWELAFDYSIEGVAGAIAGSEFQVSEIPAGQKWIQSFNSSYYASIAYPQSYAPGCNNLQAYINQRIVGTNPYLIVEGGYKIVITAKLGTTVLPASTLLWNTETGVYEGDVDFDNAGLWTLYFKVLDATTDALVAGDNGTDSNLKWLIQVNQGGTGIGPIAVDTGVKIYPAVTQGDVTIVTLANATINIINAAGWNLQRIISVAGAPLTFDLSQYGKGLYLINAKTENGESFTGKVIVK